ncbi:MAG: hypothetical protein JST26_05815 [Bacteroidetes bacterium]|nr:hypothetical protein [Bacteroidota bacterium]
MLANRYTKQIAATIIVLLCSIHAMNAQMVGGRGDNQALPKEVKAAELSKGAYTSDVNLFSGTMNTSYDLGSVSTFAGLKFDLQLSYSSTKTVGQNPLVVNGIPYGDGWNINLPTISISTACYQAYLSSEIISYNNGIGTPSLAEAKKDGELLWFSPQISIPGVVSDRFVFKNYTNGQAIFVPNAMEHYVEARFDGTRWFIYNNNGDSYVFNAVITNFRSASNLRFDNYTSDLASTDIVPKEEAMTWLCTGIYNKNHPSGQQISFNYQMFGVFDFFKEFGANQPYFSQYLAQSVGYTLSMGNFKAGKDFILTSVGSYSDKGEIERIDLQYSTVLPSGQQHNMLLPNDPLVHRMDSLYNSKTVYSRGVDTKADSTNLQSLVQPNTSISQYNISNNFTNWRRYMHVMHNNATRAYNISGGNTAFSNPSNPYLFYDLSYPTVGHYKFSSVPSTSKDVAFDHCFLESEKITNSTSTAYDIIVPGDIYEIKTAIYDPHTGVNSNPAKICNYDINIVNGKGTPSGATETIGTNADELLGNDYDGGSRGFTVFSTFNNPVKWTSLANTPGGSSSGIVSTSNFFMMPKMPSAFKGLNIQIGPANSDHDFSYNLMDGGNYHNLLVGTTYLPYEGNAFLAYNRAKTVPYHGNETPNTANQLDNPYHKPGNNFGIGLPWFMMTGAYGTADDNVLNALAPRYKFWWYDINASVTGTGVQTNWGKSSPYDANVPTAADASVYLGAVELVRYSKNPYMLTSVKKYKLNGYTANDNPALDGHVLVSQLDLSYEFKEDSLFDYQYGSLLSNNCNKAYQGKTMIGFQNFYLLKEVKQIPVNGAAHNAAFTFNRPDMPSTHFTYTKIDNDPAHRNFTNLDNFSGNIRLLSTIVDQLGGKMSYEYFPINDSAHTLTGVVSYDYSRVATTTADPYNLPAKTVFKIQFAVKYKKYYNSTSATLPTKTWRYEYGTGNTSSTCTVPVEKVVRVRGAETGVGVSTQSHYVTDGNAEQDIGFKTTRVYYPQLDPAITNVPYDRYTHFSSENRYLTFGKVQKVEHFDAAGLLLSKTEYTYAATMAYSHGLLGRGAVSNFYNQTDLEFPNGIATAADSAHSPGNTKANMLNMSLVTTITVYSSSMAFLDLRLPTVTATPGNTDNNSYFVRLIKEQNTDYDYQPLSVGNWASVLTNANLPGVSLGSINLPAPNTNPNRVATNSAIAAYSGISPLRLGLNLATAHNATLGTIMSQNSMSTISEYSYWDCDSLGTTTSDGFRYLINGTNTMTNAFTLAFEPSWELFRKKTYSPDHPNMYSSEEHFFYYDLKQYINTGGFYNSSQFTTPDKFDALKYSHIYHIRNLPYEKRTKAKATNDNEIASSEYYWYDTKTQTDTAFAYKTINYTGPFTCTDSTGSSGSTNVTPTPNIPCGCIPITHGFITPPAGYQLTDFGNGQYMFCPYSTDPEYVGTSSSHRERILPSDLNTKLLLRQVARQVDTIDRRSASVSGFTGRYHNTLRFTEITATDPVTSLNYLTYVWSPGYDTIVDYRTHSHTPFGFVREESNERGLHTRYYYSPAWSTSFINTSHPCENRGYFDLTNQGVPGCVTVGSNSADSLQTCYTYNADFTVNSITDANGMSISYGYDYFSRLQNAYRNGQLMSVNAYSQWLNDTTKTFEQRAEQNYVESFILQDIGSTVAEHSRAYVDPLGRKYDVQTQITSDYTNSSILDVQMIHSGLTIYDNWDRALQQYKPFKYTNGGAAVSFAPRFNPTGYYTEQAHEPNQRGRTLKAAKYGENINTGHTVNSTYQIINGWQLRSELGNGFYVYYPLGTTLQTPLTAFKFLKTSAIDEDGKKTITYTNAFGQKVASKTYSALGSQEVTAFTYNSQGQLIKVLNPKLQQTNYAYNLVGNMYQKVTVDADTVKYMYDVSGHVVLEEDANARHGVDDATNAPYLRHYTYDQFGRMTKQERQHYTSTQNPLRYVLESIPTFGTGTGNNFYHVFSYAASIDAFGGWFNHYCIYGPSGNPCHDTLMHVFTAYTGAAIPEKKWFYHNAEVSTDADLASGFSTYISSNAPGTTNGQNRLKGRLGHCKSYDHSGTFSNLSIYSYNTEGLLNWELKQFNVPGSSAILSSILYNEYNLRNSLKKMAIDVDFDGAKDMIYTYAYDGWNRLNTVSAKKGSGSTAKLADYAYDDALGLLTKTRYFDQAVSCDPVVDSINYSYDVRNRLTTISSKFYKETLTYDGNHLQAVSSPFLVQNDYNYNGNINIAKHEYFLASASNYGSTAGLMDSATIYGYKYDGINRLTTADASVLNVLTGTPTNYTPKLKYGDESYTYDAIGNILTMKRGIYYGPTVSSPANWVQNWNYKYIGTSSTNKLSEIDSTNTTQLRGYTYDYNGNQRGQTAYTKTFGTSYMRSNLPDTSLIGSSLYEIYQYNSNDDRIFKKLSDNSIKTYYLRDINGKELVEFDMTGVSGGTWKHYAYGKDRIAEIHGHDWNFEVNDHLGTTRVVYTPTNTCSGATVYQLDNANDIYPYGRELRTFNSSSVSEFAYQGSEKEKELSNNDYYTHFRGLDADIGRWKQVDPKIEEQMNWTPYASMNGNPISNTDVLGDIVEYAGFRDRINVRLARMFNRDFRAKFEEWNRSADIYKFEHDKSAPERLVDASAWEVSCNNGVATNMVCYSGGFNTIDISNNALRGFTIPFSFAFNIGKIPVAAFTGIGIGIHNIFSKHDIGWGWGNKLGKNNFLSWGFGNYNKYNMFGQRLTGSAFGSARISPKEIDGLLGLRISQGKKYPILFIDHYPSINIDGTSYHLHLNIASHGIRRSKLRNEHVCDVKH